MATVRDDEYEALADFRYALRRFLRFSEQAAQAVGLTPQQHQALLSIRGARDRRAATVGDLAERLQIRHHSAVGLADRLADHGLITRRCGEKDRRQVLLDLTPEGERLLAALSEAHRREIDGMAAELSSLLARLRLPDSSDPA